MADNQEDITIPFPIPEPKRKGVNAATLSPIGVRWGLLDLADIDVVCAHYGFERGTFIRNVVNLVTQQLKQRIREDVRRHSEGSNSKE